jgi:hypothetical protein
MVFILNGDQTIKLHANLFSVIVVFRQDVSIRPDASINVVYVSIFSILTPFDQIGGRHATHKTLTFIPLDSINQLTIKLNNSIVNSSDILNIHR